METVEYHLRRVYHPRTTIGELWRGETLLCYTIELPWRNNTRRTSCIPEGRYPVRLRHSPKFGRKMLAVEPVPGRTGILIHVGTDADDRDGKTHLHGCIAPVTSVRIGNGTVRGMDSTPATAVVEDMMKKDLANGGVVLVISNHQITIK